MIGFERTRSFENTFNTSPLGVQGELDTKQVARLARIKQAWNYYEGYHWEEMGDQDTPELTVNYCRTFVDKFVSFELGKGFSMSVHKSMSEPKVTPDGRTLFEYLEDVWEDNNQFLFVTELGQSKSITGEAWVQVRYYGPEELDDPFNEYPNGRVQLDLLPTSTIFPEFDPHQRGVLNKVTVMYSYEKVIKTPILSKTRKVQTLYKQIWTKDECVIVDGKEEPVVIPNRYKAIPFIQIKNLVVANRNEGRGDLEDIIPLNTEYNMKESDVSEIIDYHAAPVTVVYGAKIGNLEKGANKMWGGLSKDARVENLELKGDLGASSHYIETLKTSMCEVGGIPETVLGGSQAISNTSGVALQYINLPLIEKTRLKRASTENGLERLNKMILLVSMFEGLIKKPSNIPTRDFFWNAVTLPDTLPKDELIELQKLQQEIQMGLESRRGAMVRLGKENVDEKIKEIDADRKQNPEAYGMANTSQINSGMTNGQTPNEQYRIETTGQNGGSEG